MEMDVSNFGNLTVLEDFKSTPSTIATPHNVFIRSNDNSRVVMSYYQDGVQIFDITNPSSVTRSGFFDTDTNDCLTCPTPGYSGCWGVYIDLPSGIILASDMQNGLYVLDANNAMVGTTSLTNTISVNVFPNPFSNDFQMNFSLAAGDKFSYKLADISGKVLLEKEANLPAGKTTLNIDTRSLPASSYMLYLKSKNSSLSKKLIKTNK